MVFYERKCQRSRSRLYQFFSVLIAMNFSLFAQPVKLLSPLKSNQNFLYTKSSDKIFFEARFDQTINWELVLNGKTTGNRDTLRGDDSVIKTFWSGSNWSTSETVFAHLHSPDLDSSIPGNSLRLSFNLFCSQNNHDIKPGGIIKFQNFEEGSIFNNLGGSWTCFSDANTGGKSNISPLNVTDFIVAGVGNPGHAIQISLNVDQTAGIETTLRKSGTINLSNFESIIFDYKTTGNVDSFNFVLPTENIKNLAYSYITLPGSSTWITRKVNLEDLNPPNWSSTDNDPDLKQCSKLRWEVIGPGKSGTFLLDNICLKLKDGLLPDEDILSLITSSTRKNSNIKGKHHIFDITQSNQGLLIKSNNFLPSRIEMFNLNGKRVFQYEINSSKNSSSFFVPLYNNQFSSGQYIILLCDKPGSPFMMARKFILQ
ncbi:MAG TPA: carbohydrate binding domain-containing protein [Chitinispirillaceae bacterium]|nr:carbohydrate binding domain-containing protein [Chitinispirillaceae bacterium]